jgi:peptidyl-prolyl cis-trans isomerase A (cyclophilin A)
MAYLGQIGPTGRLSMWIVGLSLALGLALPAGASVCSPSDEHPVVHFETVVGNFDVELCHEDVPETVQNFLSYVDDDSYTDTGFVHRVLSGAGGSTGVIQGGSWYVDFELDPVDFAMVAARDPIDLDATLTNTQGAIAMARTSDPNSATSGWFINTKDNSSAYDGSYAAFGEVIAGLDVVLAIGALPLDSTTYPWISTSIPVYNSDFVWVTAVTRLPEPGAALQSAAALGVLALLARRRRAS